MSLKRIMSFGFKHDLPPLQLAGTVVIDVRKMFRNPFHNPALRTLRGTDKAVQDDIRLTPHFDALYENLKRQVTVPGIEVAFIGCSGGHHRSVFLAELLAKELGVPVEHRDFHAGRKIGA